MIDIRISVDSLTMSITGHAGYAETGRDIVCAGVSMLAQTLAAHMARHADEEDLLRLDMDDGMVLCMRPDGPRAEEYRVLYAFALEGLELLAGQYPEYVRIRTD